MKGSLWAWIIQRISAVLLLVFVAVHFGIMHFVDPTVEITFIDSSLRLKNTLYVIVDSGLLTLGLFHGLNGIRAIINDYWPRAGRTASYVLTVIGIVACGWGSTALFHFLNAK
ncbi:MAG: succinate dehydrogenase rane subunit [Symbiobacteriaceae bacterium]|jgi:succinate dehydrogenase / fumarate reductase membrane anchor subunit|nr:succinate dehydrogenase rane subunit [Symbiobacteriaceae bacterium]